MKPIIKSHYESVIIMKVQKCLIEKICFFTPYKKKLAKFYSTKYFIPTLQILNVICCLTCPGCNEKGISKTGCNLVTHLNEQGSRDDKPMYQHLSRWEHHNNIVNLMKLVDTDSMTIVVVDKKEYVLNSVLSNFHNVFRCRNWSQLLFLRGILHQNAGT